MKKLTKTVIHLILQQINGRARVQTQVSLTPEFLSSPLYPRPRSFSLPLLCSILGLTHATMSKKTCRQWQRKEGCSVTKLAQENHIFYLELPALTGRCLAISYPLKYWPWFLGQLFLMSIHSYFIRVMHRISLVAFLL